MIPEEVQKAIEDTITYLFEGESDYFEDHVFEVTGEEIDADTIELSDIPQECRNHLFVDALIMDNWIRKQKQDDEQYVPLTRICKDDLLLTYYLDRTPEGDLKRKIIEEKVTRKDLEHIASKMTDTICDDGIYWDSMKSAFETYIMFKYAEVDIKKVE